VLVAKGQWDTRSEINWPERDRIFAGSHAAVENIGMKPDSRSFFATCHANSVNPYHWFQAVLERINCNAPAKYHTLLPHLIRSATKRSCFVVLAEHA